MTNLLEKGSFSWEPRFVGSGIGLKRVLFPNKEGSLISMYHCMISVTGLSDSRRCNHPQSSYSFDHLYIRAFSLDTRQRQHMYRSIIRGHNFTRSYYTKY